LDYGCLGIAVWFQLVPSETDPFAYSLKGAHDVDKEWMDEIRIQIKYQKQPQNQNQKRNTRTSMLYDQQEASLDDLLDIEEFYGQDSKEDHETLQNDESDVDEGVSVEEGTVKIVPRFELSPTSEEQLKILLDPTSPVHESIVSLIQDAVSFVFIPTLL
jgi:hypothetical protein